MRPEAGRTAEALAMRLGFYLQLADGFHDSQTGGAHFMGILPILVVDAPPHQWLPGPSGFLHGHAVIATPSANASGFALATRRAYGYRDEAFFILRLLSLHQAQYKLVR